MRETGLTPSPGTSDPSFNQWVQDSILALARGSQIDDTQNVIDANIGNNAGDLVTIDGAQTLTNKTLTSPVTNGGTFNSPALVTPDLGTPASGNLANCDHYPIDNVTNLGANVLALLKAPNVTNFVAAINPAIATIASGNLSGAAVPILNIPQSYAYIVLVVTGASSGSTEQTMVQPSVDNGGSYDSSAANYQGVIRTGTTLSAPSLASLTESATHTAAQSDSFTLYLFGYQMAGDKLCHARIKQNGVEYSTDKYWVGSASAINALQILGSAGGTFDAGTYALYGVL